MRVTSLATALFLAGALAACSGDTQPQDPYASVDAFCDAKAQAECQVAPRCAVQGDACLVVRRTACMQEATQATAASRRYSSAHAPACIDAVSAVYSKGIVTPADLGGPGSMSDTCQRVYVGTTPGNAPCTLDYECAQAGAVCAPAAYGSNERVCAVAVTKRIGDFCADPGSVCQSGAWCAPVEDGAPQCLARHARGESCGFEGPVVQCADGLRCTSPGLCDARLPAGAPCKGSDDCGPDAPLCDVTLERPVCDAGLSFAVGAPVCKQYGGDPPR